MQLLSCEKVKLQLCLIFSHLYLLSHTGVQVSFCPLTIISAHWKEALGLVDMGETPRLGFLWSLDASKASGALAECTGLLQKRANLAAA